MKTEIIEASKDHETSAVTLIFYIEKSKVYPMDLNEPNGRSVVTISLTAKETVDLKRFLLSDSTRCIRYTDFGV